MSDDTTHVVTDRSWDTHFDRAQRDNANLVFVRPAWLDTCHRQQRQVDPSPFAILPPD